MCKDIPSVKKTGKKKNFLQCAINKKNEQTKGNFAGAFGLASPAFRNSVQMLLVVFLDACLNVIGRECARHIVGGTFNN